jgi:hypothetical protein
VQKGLILRGFLDAILRWRWVQSAANHSQGYLPVILNEKFKIERQNEAATISFRLFRALPYG